MKRKGNRAHVAIMIRMDFPLCIRETNIGEVFSRNGEDSFFQSRTDRGCRLLDIVDFHFSREANAFGVCPSERFSVSLFFLRLQKQNAFANLI